MTANSEIIYEDIDPANPPQLPLEGCLLSEPHWTENDCPINDTLVAIVKIRNEWVYLTDSSRFAKCKIPVVKKRELDDKTLRLWWAYDSTNNVWRITTTAETEKNFLFRATSQHGFNFCIDKYAPGPILPDPTEWINI